MEPLIKWLKNSNIYHLYHNVGKFLKCVIITFTRSKCQDKQTL